MMMTFMLILISTLATQASSHDWIPGYLDKNGILHTFHKKYQDLPTSESETSTEKILLRIRFHKNKTSRTPEVTGARYQAS